MPGARFTKNADTPRRERMWDDFYQSGKNRGIGEKRAIMMANSAVAKDKEKRKRTTKMKRGPVATGFRG